MEYRQQMVGSNDSYGLDGIPTPQRLNQQKELTPNSMQMMCPSCNSLVMINDFSMKIINYKYQKAITVY